MLVVERRVRGRVITRHDEIDVPLWLVGEISAEEVNARIATIYKELALLSAAFPD